MPSSIERSISSASGKHHYQDENDAHCSLDQSIEKATLMADDDAIVSRYHTVSRDQLIQRLLLKKWTLLHEIECFLIDVSDNYLNYYIANADNPPMADPSSLVDDQVLQLIKKQNQLRTHNAIDGHQPIDIMQTSKRIDQLRSLSIAQLHEILHDFDTFQRDIRELIAAQQGTLVFTTLPIEETVDHLLKGYITISRY